MIANAELADSFVLCYGGQRIPFRVAYRKRKKLAITVHPEMRLEVVAPEDSPTEQILLRIEKRAGWILKQWQYFQRFQPIYPGSKYVSGETHTYLGRQYRLKVKAGFPEAVKLSGRFFHVLTKDCGRQDRIKGLLEHWYREHAERVLTSRLRNCLENVPALGLSCEPRVIIRSMTYRWGSCTRAGNVLLNTDLIKVPIHCVDYVIVHELCHLKIHNHGPKFHHLLNRCMPDWERRKARLESRAW